MSSHTYFASHLRHVRGTMVREIVEDMLRKFREGVLVDQQDEFDPEADDDANDEESDMHMLLQSMWDKIEEAGKAEETEKALSVKKDVGEKGDSQSRLAGKRMQESAMKGLGNRKEKRQKVKVEEDDFEAFTKNLMEVMKEKNKLRKQELDLEERKQDRLEKKEEEEREQRREERKMMEEMRKRVFGSQKN